MGMPKMRRCPKRCHRGTYISIRWYQLDPPRLTCTLFDHSGDKGFFPPLTTLLSRNPNCSQPISGFGTLFERGPPPLGLGTLLNIGPSPLAYQAIEKLPRTRNGVHTMCFNLKQVLITLPYCLINDISGGPNGPNRKKTKRR